MKMPNEKGLNAVGQNNLYYQHLLDGSVTPPILISRKPFAEQVILAGLHCIQVDADDNKLPIVNMPAEVRTKIDRNDVHWWTHSAILHPGKASFDIRHLDVNYGVDV